MRCLRIASHYVIALHPWHSFIRDLLDEGIPWSLSMPLCHHHARPSLTGSVAAALHQLSQKGESYSHPGDRCESAILPKCFGAAAMGLHLKKSAGGLRRCLFSQYLVLMPSHPTSPPPPPQHTVCHCLPLAAHSIYPAARCIPPPPPRMPLHIAQRNYATAMSSAAQAPWYLHEGGKTPQSWGESMQYPVERYVGMQDCHICDWQPACQPAIPSSNAEGNRELTCIYFSKESSTLAKVLKGLQADGRST
jgi:hypothetical protein